MIEAIPMAIAEGPAGPVDGFIFFIALLLAGPLVFVASYWKWLFVASILMGLLFLNGLLGRAQRGSVLIDNPVTQWLNEEVSLGRGKRKDKE